MKLLIITQKVDEKDQLLGFFIEWIKHLAGKFSRINVICLEKGEFNLPENIRVFSLGKEYGANKLKQLFTFYLLLFTLRNDYDAVFVHMNPIWMVLGGICWKLLNKKRILWYTHKSVTFKLRLAEKLADVILTASPESFRLKSKKVVVTGHGIDIGLFQPSEKLKVKRPGEGSREAGIASEKLKILSVGRIAPVKNYETLIEAARILKEQGVDFKVTMVGEAPLEQDKEYEKSLKLKIKNLKLEENFKFVGKVNHENLPQYYQSHDIFVHLSKTGSLDKTLLEAGACGMKVLSSNDSSPAFLPSKSIFKENDPVELVKKILILEGQPADSQIRNYIVQNHNLNILIDKISKYIQQ